jgi:hypothetical protein
LIFDIAKLRKRSRMDDRALVRLTGTGVEVVKASSVLRRNVKEFSPMNVLDDSDETCWNSDSVCDTAAAARCLHVRPRAGPCGRVVAGLQPYFMPVVCALAQGSPQSLDIQFKRVVSVRQLQLTFQGGFVGQVRLTTCCGWKPSRPHDCCSCVVVPRLQLCSLRSAPSQECVVEGTLDGSSWEPLGEHIHPVDCNDMQIRKVPLLARLVSNAACALACDAVAGDVCIVLVTRRLMLLSLHEFAFASKDVVRLRIVFLSSSDFYGRVIVYKLAVLGHEASAAQ